MLKALHDFSAHMLLASHHLRSSMLLASHLSCFTAFRKQLSASALALAWNYCLGLGSSTSWRVAFKDRVEKHENPVFAFG